MKKVIAITAAALVSTAVAVEGFMWWRNVHPHFPEHEVPEE